jgi:hypothetical protein
MAACAIACWWAAEKLARWFDSNPDRLSGDLRDRASNPELDVGESAPECAGLSSDILAEFRSSVFD